MRPPMKWVFCTLINFGQVALAQTEATPPAALETPSADAPASIPDAEPSSAEAAPPAPVESAVVSEPAGIPAAASTGGLLGPIRVGVSSSVEFPHFFNYSFDALYEHRYGLSFSFGQFYNKMEDIEAEIMNWDVRFRWFPWATSFFLGTSCGSQSLAAKTTQDLRFNFSGSDLTIPATIKVEVDTGYVTPHFGWFANWDWGLTLGFELGYQVALNAKAKTLVGFANVSSTVENEVRATKDFQDALDDVNVVAEGIGKKSVPYIALLRLGFML